MALELVRRILFNQMAGWWNVLSLVLCCTSALLLSFPHQVGEMFQTNFDRPGLADPLAYCGF